MNKNSIKDASFSIEIMEKALKSKPEVPREWKKFSEVNKGKASLKGVGSCGHRRG